MYIEISNVNYIFFHDVDLVLLLTGHLDVYNGCNELLRFFISDEHLLEIDHLLGFQLPTFCFLLAVEFFNKKEIFLLPSGSAVGFEGPADDCMFGGVEEGNRSVSVDTFIDEVVDVVGRIIVVDLFSDAWTLSCSLQEEFLVVGVTVEREGVDDGDLLFGEGFDDVVGDAVIEAVNLAELDLSVCVVDECLDGGCEIRVDQHVFVVGVKFVSDNCIYF